MLQSEMNFGKRLRAFLVNNAVTIIFVVIAIYGFSVTDNTTGTRTSAFINEVTVRFFRNGLLVLSLIIPVMAGLGLNFGIVIGALAGMIGIIFVRYNALIPDSSNAFHGFGGLLLCFLIATPIALLFGYLTGKLYNRTRGQETISSLIVGFFAQALYLIVVLFVVGGIIPVVENHQMIIPTTGDRPIGIRASFDPGLPISELFEPPEGTRSGLTRSLDGLMRIDFMQAVILLAVALLLVLIVKQLLARKNPAANKAPRWLFWLRCGFLLLLLVFAAVSTIQLNKWTQILANTNLEMAQNATAAGLFHRPLRMDQLPDVSRFVVEVSRLQSIPVVTGAVIIAVCLFITYFTKTKLGQDCRSVGQSQHIANAAGINVDRTRIIATMLSTLLASWGMIIFLQSMGTVSTYNAQQHIGFFSVAALLVGGASASKAAVPNAMLGLILFHSMFIVSPGIGRHLTGDELVGEYLRSFLAYGVIGVSLGLHAWKVIRAAREREKLDRNEAAKINEKKEAEMQKLSGEKAS